MLASARRVFAPVLAVPLVLVVLSALLPGATAAAGGSGSSPDGTVVPTVARAVAHDTSPP